MFCEPATFVGQIPVPSLMGDRRLSSTKQQLTELQIDLKDKSKDAQRPLGQVLVGKG